MSHSIYRTRIINLIKKQQGTLGKRETECFDLTSIIDLTSVKRFSKILISIKSRENLEKKRKKSIFERQIRSTERQKKENQDERILQGIFGTRQTMSRAETQGGARGNFPVEILLRSWQPTFTRFLAAREVNGAGKTL